MKAGWSEDIVMERIWWQEIRMNASDFRRETPIPARSGVIIRWFFTQRDRQSDKSTNHFYTFTVNLPMESLLQTYECFHGSLLGSKQRPKQFFIFWNVFHIIIIIPDKPFPSSASEEGVN